MDEADASDGAMLPIRVARRGWFRVFHPSEAELEDAVERAAERARGLVFHDVGKLQRFIGRHVRAELCVSVKVEYDADTDGTAARLLAVSTAHAGPAYVLMGPETVAE